MLAKQRLQYTGRVPPEQPTSRCSRTAYRANEKWEREMRKRHGLEPLPERPTTRFQQIVKPTKEKAATLWERFIEWAEKTKLKVCPLVEIVG